jgi:hypothetical protein
MLGVIAHPGSNHNLEKVNLLNRQFVEVRKIKHPMQFPLNHPVLELVPTFSNLLLDWQPSNAHLGSQPLPLSIPLPLCHNVLREELQGLQMVIC